MQVVQHEPHRVEPCEHLFVAVVLRRQQDDRPALQKLDESRLVLEYIQQSELRSYLWGLVNFQLESLFFYENCALHSFLPKT